MIRLAPLALAAALTLTACAGINHAMSTYGDVPPVHHEHAGLGWRVFDRPQDGLLMITPSLGRAAAHGLRAGSTFGLSEGGITGPAQPYAEAAQAWLDQRDQRCRLTQGRVVLPVQIEFDYTCG